MAHRLHKHNGLRGVAQRRVKQPAEHGAAPAAERLRQVAQQHGQRHQRHEAEAENRHRAPLLVDGAEGHDGGRNQEEQQVRVLGHQLLDAVAVAADVVPRTLRPLRLPGFRFCCRSRRHGALAPLRGVRSVGMRQRVGHAHRAAELAEAQVLVASATLSSRIVPAAGPAPAPLARRVVPAALPVAPALGVGLIPAASAAASSFPLRLRRCPVARDGTLRLRRTLGMRFAGSRRVGRHGLAREARAQDPRRRVARRNSHARSDSGL